MLLSVLEGPWAADVGSAAVADSYHLSLQVHLHLGILVWGMESGSQQTHPVLARGPPENRGPAELVLR